jgi:hypothetical protein
MTPPIVRLFVIAAVIAFLLAVLTGFGWLVDKRTDLAVGFIALGLGLRTVPEI